jgi:pimeloyl-ACP methyl ester carboxylesterase
MVTPDEWRSRGDTFAWRGEQIFFRVEGDGDPLLLVHGFPTASWDYAAIWPQLVAHYRVITLDMIGYGFSAKPRSFTYSTAAQADLIEALLAREKITSYRLVAHDYGVSVAQELLARKHDLVSVCLLNGGLFPETHRALVTQRLLASPLGPLVARFSTYRTFAASMNRVWGSHPLSSEERRAMWQLVSRDHGLQVLPKLIGYIAERRAHRERWVGALVDTQVPIRLINGLADPVSGAHMLVRYRELVAQPNIVELPGVGHYPQVEAPEAVVHAIRAHFTSGT